MAKEYNRVDIRRDNDMTNNTFYSDNVMEQLLQEQRMKEASRKEQLLLPDTSVIRTQRANKGASIRDFIKMLADLVSKVLKNYDVTLDPDEGHITSPTDKMMGHPYIVYSIVSREPKLEKKDRILDYIVDEDGRHGELWARDFICVLQFNVVASNCQDADDIMEAFEELISKYTGYFKENGVSEVLFKKQLTDHNFDVYRQSRSIRSLQYRIDIQKIKTSFDTTIKDVRESRN
jgi:hypothetical protein